MTKRARRRGRAFFADGRLRFDYLLTRAIKV
jgi:hypothetical protein